ncbi:phosphopantothenate--cysteine ligase [Streptococcus dentapri]|uniref:Phosphopantothenate--cysteine ligase n=1 Tax=Streptococcus dentapri TaxID=573564 RepID=A0ABV8D1B5_9STRE
MKILITSGGTSEAIDSVRAITNQSTGSLGKIMAEIFLKAGHEVTLVTTKNAVKPAEQSRLTIYQITDVASLIATLKTLVKSHDVLIHSMAVSDYTPVYMADFAELQTVTDPAQLLAKRNQETKISSQAEHQVLFLTKTPKVISQIVEWNPNIKLIGFKLLVDVPHEELIEVARESLIKNKADYILANDLKDIQAHQHIGYLVSKTEEIRANTKEDIAQLILERITDD